MYIIKTSSSFDSAHFLSGYLGKCANIHGHRWTVEIEVCSDALLDEGNSRGMIVDFAKLKHDLSDITEGMDHALIIEKGSLKSKTMEALTEERFKIIEVDFRPTAENFAKFFYDKIEKKGYEVHSATVYETPNNSARYIGNCAT